MIKASLLYLFILIHSTFSQTINKNDRYVYYGSIAALYASSYLIPDHDPWIASDSLKQKFESSNTIPTTTLVGINIASVSLMTVALSNDYKNDPSGLYNTLGHIEALIASHGMTTFVKKMVQRERPNKGRDKVSFWSGHAAAAFTSATYMTRYVNDYSNFSDSGKYTSALLSLAYASYVSWTRVDDYQHHTSDVIVGAIWGILASNYIYEIRNNGLHNLFSTKKKNTSKSFRLNFNFNL